MPPETDNLKLLELYQLDQSDRAKALSTAAEIKELKQKDAMRKTLVAEMMSRGEVNTANDLFHAAVIFQHGSEPKDFLAAHRLAVIASVNGHRGARWMAATSLDRFLMASGMAQVYGTQFEFNEEDSKYQLRLPIDDS